MTEPDGYDDGHDDDCIADDSTECDCSRCTAAEDRFWREQQGLDDDDEPYAGAGHDDYRGEPDGEDRP